MQVAEQRLTGSELLLRVAQLGSASKGEKARSCGYVSVSDDGRERINFTAFYEALAVASGVALAEVKERRKPPLSYKTRVLTTGAILIGPRYAEELGVAPGDPVELEVKDGELTARPS